MGVLERVGQGFLPDVEKVLLPGVGKLRQSAAGLKLRVKRRAGGRALNNTFERIPKILFLQCLRAQRVHGAPRLAQASPGQLPGAVQMFVCVLAGTVGDRILGGFQLHDHTGKTLRERVVDVSRHPVSFFKDRGALTLLGELIELKREHDLVCERLSQFYFFWPVRRTIDVANANEASDVSTHQKRHSEKPLCAVSFQMLTQIAANARISCDVVANHRTSREKQLLDYRVPFPRQRVFDEWVLRLERAKFSALYY